MLISDQDVKRYEEFCRNTPPSTEISQEVQEYINNWKKSLKVLLSDRPKKTAIDAGNVQARRLCPGFVVVRFLDATGQAEAMMMIQKIKADGKTDMRIGYAERGPDGNWPGPEGGENVRN